MSALIGLIGWGTLIGMDLAGEACTDVRGDVERDESFKTPLALQWTPRLF